MNILHFLIHITLIDTIACNIYHHRQFTTILTSQALGGMLSRFSILQLFFAPFVR